VLTGRGYAYLTDETACLAPENLRITPFRKPLSLKPGSHEVLARLRPASGSVADLGSDRQWLVSPEALEGAAVPTSPLLPTLVVFPTHTPGSTTQVQRLSEAEAAYALGSNTVRLWWVRGGGLQALARMARRVPAYRLVYDDVREAADRVEELWGRLA
jgi:hypothetical protein